MPNTVIGLFRNTNVVNHVVGEIESLGFARNEVRRAEEPDTFEITGVMSFPRLDFETGLGQRLKAIGASEAEAQVYLDGLRKGGTVVFATDPDEKKVRAAAAIMNRNSAVETDEGRGPEPYLPSMSGEGRTSRETPDIAGRVAQSPQPGTSYFSW